LARSLMILGLVLLLASSQAHALVIEAESFVASHNAGGDPIVVISCSAASGNYAVEGFDSPGDWIELVLNVPAIYGYVDTLRSAGYLYYESNLRTTVFGADPNGGDVVSAYHTIGAGIG
jgi:hypothetical protein